MQTKCRADAICQANTNQYLVLCCVVHIKHKLRGSKKEAHGMAGKGNGTPAAAAAHSLTSPQYEYRNKMCWIERSVANYI